MRLSIKTHILLFCLININSLLLSINKYRILFSTILHLNSVTLLHLSIKLHISRMLYLSIILHRSTLQNLSTLLHLSTMSCMYLHSTMLHLSTLLNISTILNLSTLRNLSTLLILSTILHQSTMLHLSPMKPLSPMLDTFFYNTTWCYQQDGLKYTPCCSVNAMCCNLQSSKLSRRTDCFIFSWHGLVELASWF